MTDTDTSLARSTSLATMGGIEARRLARSPIFLGGVVLAFAVVGVMVVLNEDPVYTDLLPTPLIAAFFIGLSSLVATARITRSTEAAVEAVGTTPGTEAQRTAAVLLACLVPFVAGLVFVLVVVVVARSYGVAEQEWWFATLPDWQVWSILLATGPVACLGGALLGVLTGRWLHFPGAASVVLVAVVLVSFAGSVPVAQGEHSELRLWVPWPMWHSGTLPDGTQSLYAGNPLAHLGYVLCLCAAAALVAIWHDRTARTTRLRVAIIAVVVVGLVCLALAITTGNTDNLVSEPNPFRIE
jgi:multisubunit Na+/H+ antiporter MnhB subunit